MMLTIVGDFNLQELILNGIQIGNVGIGSGICRVQTARKIAVKNQILIQEHLVYQAEVSLIVSLFELRRVKNEERILLSLL